MLSGGQKRHFFRKSALKNRYVFPEGFPPGGAATHRRVFCFDFLRMFKILLECLDFCWNVYTFLRMFRYFLKCLDLFWKCLDFFQDVEI